MYISKQFLNKLFCQMSLISSVIPLDSPEVFLDLSSECEYFGRVYIQLWGHLRRANQFLALCLGTLGPTYMIDSHFFEAYGRNQPGECLHGGEYMINNRKSGQGLMEDLEWGDQWQLTQEEGMIVGAGNGRAERNTCFDICTIGNPLKEFACPFGRVISGLDVVKRAIHHNPVRQVTISECGFLVPFTTL
ncbi:unnamed protein product [Meganyctiphanes norvegica]|uniref:PPIase cyclophilin-type domain-containing protein n=1 Tax=Meganyctiphanes norvegica TaxID=48144 RepID=A0AAV2PRZ2_MEGNR